MNKEYLFIFSGGTLDAEPHPHPFNPPADVVPLDFSIAVKHFGQMMKKKGLKEGESYDFLHWKAKDSKYFTTEDLKDLADIIRTSKHKKIIIAHGTDHMVFNSKMIKELLKTRKKTIVFTGGMIPLANDPANVTDKAVEKLLEMPWYAKSDAIENMETAVRAADIMDKEGHSGVYIAFDRKIFDPARTIKNFDLKRFESDSAISL